MTAVLKAAVFREGFQEAGFEDLNIPELRDDEVLVRLVATGVCHTDITCRDGFMTLPRPIVLGHEGAGVVEAVGSAVSSVTIGDHVVMSFLPCGDCVKCRAGVPTCCHNFALHNFTARRPDGSSALVGAAGEQIPGHFFGQSSFATLSAANERNVIKVRTDAPLELLGPLGCGVMTGAGSVLNVLQPKNGESLAIFGAGGVGLSGAMAAKIAGCSPIIVIEPNAQRRALALEIGATHALDPGAEDDIVAAIHALIGGPLDHALDTCGIPAVIAQALAALGTGGRIALLTMNALDAAMVEPLASIVGRSLTIRGVNMGNGVPATFVPQLVDYIMEGRFPLEKLVRFYPFEKFNQAMADQDSGAVVKPIITFR